MKKRVMAYFLSAASVYLTMGYLTHLFMSMVSGFTLNVI
jgi:hypothetical protein